MNQDDSKKNQRVYGYTFKSIYPLYLEKVEKKGRTKAEVDEVLRWLTGYSQAGIEEQIEKQANLETFFAEAPQLNPSRSLLTGVVCGVRVEEIKEPLMREIRYMDLLIDKLAKGRAMEKLLPTP